MLSRLAQRFGGCRPNERLLLRGILFIPNSSNSSNSTKNMTTKI